MLDLLIRCSMLFVTCSPVLQHREGCCCDWGPFQPALNCLVRAVATLCRLALRNKIVSNGIRISFLRPGIAVHAFL